MKFFDFIHNIVKKGSQDVYGILIDADYFVFKKGIKFNDSAKQMILNLGRKIEKSWQKRPWYLGNQGRARAFYL